jgi:hypothetical protein
VTGTDYFGVLAADQRHVGGTVSLHDDSWCLSPRSRRSCLVQPGDLIALWVTGAKNPGIYEFGWVTDNRVEQPSADGSRPEPSNVGVRPDRKVHYTAVRLGVDGHVPRSLMQATPVLDRCEQLRASMMSNPSYLTVSEAEVLAGLVAARVPDEEMSAARWDTLLR